MGEVVELFGGRKGSPIPKKNFPEKISGMSPMDQGKKGLPEIFSSMPAPDGKGTAADLLRAMVETIVGDLTSGEGDRRLEESARTYQTTIEGYSEEEIIGLLARADDFKNIKPAFYLALRNRARELKLPTK